MRQYIIYVDDKESFKSDKLDVARANYPYFVQENPNKVCRLVAQDINETVLAEQFPKLFKS